MFDPQGFSSRAGHRFNQIIRSLPGDASLGLTIEELLLKLKPLGYRGGIEGLKVDLQELIRRGEVASSQEEGKTVYWCLPRGKIELRKRTVLIRLHNLELREEDIEALEEVARRAAASQDRS
ncbi:MAG: hypothetical protein QFX35_06715 [Candidatus Verstraetearchaeota archaeon]|nr:hypothetical protein [Candidatus Verstraetearchaeota archaeon]